MKKYLLVCITAVMVVLSGCYKDDINDLNDKYDKLKEEQQKQAETLAAYQTLLNALNAKLTVTGFTQTPDGYTITFSDGSTMSIKPDPAAVSVERIGNQLVFTFSDGTTMSIDMDLYVIDFESSFVADYLAGPTSYGENLYETYDGSAANYKLYSGYTDPSGISMMLNGANFWEGGIAISQWNDITTEGYLNQCSAYYSDITTGFGGCNGSKTFAIANGYGDSGAVISFDTDTEGSFDHFWVANSTYVALTMLNGDDFGTEKFGIGDWFKLIINAFDKNGVATGETVEFYLADFRTATSPGIITKWTMIDLKPLGDKVNTIKFDLQSSDVGDWGMNTPGYFCFDNLAIKR